MITNFLIFPFIYITAFFLDVFTSQKKLKNIITIYNIIYGLVLSVVYGFLIGIFLLILFSTSEIPIWIPILYSIIFIFFINVFLSIKYKEEYFILPNQYIIIFGLMLYIIKEKYLLKSLIKLFGITTLFSFLFINIVMIVFRENLEVTKIIIIGLFISLLLAILLLNRINIQTLKQAIYQFFLYFNLFLIVFLISAVRLTLYSDFGSIITWLDMCLLMLSVIGFILSVLPYGSDVYIKFKSQFEKGYPLFWEELEKVSGYFEVKTNFIKGTVEIKDGINNLKVEWKGGGKKEIVKRALISLVLILVLWLCSYLLFQYDYLVNIGIQMVFSKLYDFWSSLFNDNIIVRKSLFLLMNFVYILYIVYKLVFAIKHKHAASVILLQINRLFFLIIIFIIFTISIYNIQASNFILFSIIFLFTSSFIINKVQHKLKENGK
ncbi:hypothetical protein [Peribacillus frigoritolerans]|uniref:hypothetical protein n=1 Tax=Peribacillus frigoritolerans TaxID=450367 RepID=UPI000FD711A1|nr:hypothetical protein [Peribacillus frigoritolerans]AZV60309.1 hypothetical protein DOZ91_06510 [Peribacillus frigoritolerans]